MKSIQTPSYAVHFGDHGYKAIKAFVLSGQFSKIFIVVDTNTISQCLPHFISKIGFEVKPEIIEIPDGESQKTIDTCMHVWNALTEMGADRNSIIMNLGGGVVTDLGGFTASTFKRGIQFINIPTSLLAMVDASVGGKTGVDLNNSKNQVGTISFAQMVIIDVSYLNTLSKNELRSGMAEMLKHGLISNRKYWKSLSKLAAVDICDLIPMIYNSVLIKNTIVLKDPKEKNIRKFLNFGHTLGHAIETYFLERQDLKTLLHGEAIAVGMVLEAYISTVDCTLKASDLKSIKETFSKIYEKISFKLSDIKAVMKLLKHDKKNSHGQVNFVLLEAIGRCRYDMKVSETTIVKAFEYYAEK